MLRSFVTSLILLTFASGTTVASPPNVVIVITDDQGHGDLSCHGNPTLKTPNIDALYLESLRLTDYHVSPTCSPTRSAFLTGHWTNRTGVWHTIMGRSMLRENEVTMGQVFKDAGYATGMFGKWHLGDNYPFRPEDRGYTDVMRHGGGGIGQTPDYWDNAYFDGSYWHNGTPTPVEGFCTDVFFEYAQAFIKQQKERKQPFLAYIATNAPHGPMHAPEAYSAPYADAGNVNLRNFFGMIANIDDNVGRMRAFLEAEGLAENTIFIFTTDNGTSSGASVFNSGMRGKKGSEYDGGHRVPFFIHWPQGQMVGGSDVNALTAHVDVLPTLIELCEIAAPKNVTFDGQSIVPLLKGGSAEWPDRILVTDSQRIKDPEKWRKSAVMTSRWRLINGKELYDIQMDPGQENNIASQHPQVMRRLSDFYEDWWAELLPTFSNATAIYLGHPAENPARLTAHDLITTGGAPWNQSHIRRGINQPSVRGFWNVFVYQGGEYEIRLRRWPEELNGPLTSALAPGSPVPGEKAFRETPGIRIPATKATLEVGDQTIETDVAPDAIEVAFDLELPPGKTKLSARFWTADGEEYGVFYAYVRKK